jgi:hypothetical protein
MKDQIKEIIKTTHHKIINVQLDYKAFTTLWRKSSLKVWLKRYPDLKVMSY